MNQDKRIMKILATIKRNVYLKTWKCSLTTCNESAINSHLLQRNGILNAITTNGHLFELRTSNVFSWEKGKSPFEFKKVGIRSALSLPIFCSKCDSSIFKKIESETLDLLDYQSFVLFNYRTTCAEQRKKEHNGEIHKRILNAENLRREIDAEYVSMFLRGTELGIIDLEKLKKIIEEEIRKPKRIFHFIAYRYPLIEVYGSAVFSVTDEVIGMDQEVRQDFDDVFIHVIPWKNELFILCGYLKDYETAWTSEYVKSWANLDGKQLRVKLTDLFASRIENWGLSPALYYSISKESMEKMIAYWNSHAMSLRKDMLADFNLFE